MGSHVPRRVSGRTGTPGHSVSDGHHRKADNDPFTVVSPVVLILRDPSGTTGTVTTEPEWVGVDRLHGEHRWVPDRGRSKVSTSLTPFFHLCRSRGEGVPGRSKLCLGRPFGHVRHPPLETPVKKVSGSLPAEERVPVCRSSTVFDRSEHEVSRGLPGVHRHAPTTTPRPPSLLHSD